MIVLLRFRLPRTLKELGELTGTQNRAIFLKWFDKLSHKLLHCRNAL